MLLPAIPDLAAYRRVYRDEATWLPAVRAICAQQGLDAAQLAFAPPGSHVVFRVGGELYIKLFAPFWGSDHVSERAVLGALDGQTRLPIPRLVAEGQIEGWPYIIITAVRGTPLCEVWDRLSESEQVQVCYQCGAFMAALHAVPTEGLGAIAVDWDAFVEARVSGCMAQVADSGLGQEWHAAIAALLEQALPSSETRFQPVLLSADVTDEHVMVEQHGGEWRFAGYIDFGDAMLGHSLYEFAAPACSITRGMPELTRAMLLGYGFAEPELAPKLVDQLMAYTLLHRFITLPDLLALFQPDVPSSLGELQQRLWPFSTRIG
ncbi:MAG: phosphotransferase family protein [Anaerolineae bacterium]